MANPTYIGTGSFTTQSFGTNVTLSSSGLTLVTGDFLIGFVVHDNANLADVWPSGWTRIPGAEFANTPSSRAISFAWHRYTSGDTLPNISWAPTNQSGTGGILQFRGVVASGSPIGSAQVTPSSNSPPSPTTFTGGGMVTVGTASLVIDFEHGAGGGTLANPSGYTACSGPTSGNLVARINETGGATTPTISYGLGGTTELYIDSQIEILSQGLAPSGPWASTETTDVFAGVGHLALGVVGDLLAVGTPDTFAAVGGVPSVGTMAVVEHADIASIFGLLPIRGPWASTEAQDIFFAAGVGLGRNGTWASTEAPDTFHATGVVAAIGTWASHEAADTFRALGGGVTVAKQRRVFFVT